MTKEKFESLTQAQQAVLLAKDVIEQVKANKYKAKQNYYIKLPKSFLTKYSGEEHEDKELQAVLPEIKTCEVCARGALFLSHVKIMDNFSLGELNPSYKNGDTDVDADLTAERVTAFSPFQQSLIELAFEGNEVYNEFVRAFDIDADSDMQYEAIEYAKKSLEDACLRFYKKYRNSNNRLIAIMENVVKNKGVFKP